MNLAITEWALRWGVPHQALIELDQTFGIEPSQLIAVHNDEKSEAYIQSLVRLEAARKGVKLWRNNVGVLPDETGRPVRYGLGNDSPALNKVIKSGDLIGWRPLLITPAHVGSKIAQFLSRECKRPDWKWSGSAREIAQLKWAEAVNADGGDANFCNAEGSL